MTIITIRASSLAELAALAGSKPVLLVFGDKQYQDETGAKL